MFYRLNIQLNLEDIERLRTLRDRIRAFCEHNIVINPDTPIQEAGFISLQRCFHDQDPSSP